MKDFVYETETAPLRDGEALFVLPRKAARVKKQVHLNNFVEEILEENTRAVIIDFSEMVYIESYGLGILLSMNKMLRQREIKLFLVNLSTRLRTVFALSRLDSILTILESREEALAQLGVESSESS